MLRTETTSLAAARDALLALPHPFTRSSVHAAVERFRPRVEGLERYLIFSGSHFTRIRYYHGPRFEILVLCWKQGQASPIHDHAASLCSMAVVQGTCHADIFRISNGHSPAGIETGGNLPLEHTARETYETGRVLTVEGKDIHRVGNFQADGSDLVTVHFYLPPLATMRCFDEKTGRCEIRRPETLLPRS